jgi:hypothetical protein
MLSLVVKGVRVLSDDGWWQVKGNYWWEQWDRWGRLGLHLELMVSRILVKQFFILILIKYNLCMNIENKKTYLKKSR